MPKCENCSFCIWDGEYQDTGHKAYDANYCDVRERLEEDKRFPYKNTKCKKFLMNFWKSEFAEEINGSDESYQIALKKWEEKYKVVV